jgi:hypothetical protein
MSLTGLSQFIKKHGNLLASGSLILVTGLIYLNTLAPGVFGFDSAELATGVFTLGIVHPPGYPLYLLLGKIFSLIPIGNLAYRLNLMSCFWGCVTIWLVYKIIDMFYGNKLIGWAAAFVLSISNYFWQMSIVAEVYTLHTAFLVLNLFFLIKWRKRFGNKWLYLFAICYGLSLGNHTSGILFAPGFAWLILSSSNWEWRNWKLTLGMALLFFCGLLPYLYFPIRAFSNPQLNYVTQYYQVDLTTPSGLLWMISGQAYRFFAFGYSFAEIPVEIARFMSFLWRNFLGAGVIIGLMGVYWNLKKDWKTFSGFLIIFLCNAIFFINYRVMDKDTMFLPAYVIWAFFLAGGIKFTIEFMEKLLKQENAMISTPAVMLLLFFPGLILNWHWVDMSHENSPEEFAQEIFRTTPQNVLIVASWSPAVIIEYYQIVEGLRPDIQVINRSRTDVAHYYKLWNAGFSRDKIIQILTTDTAQMIEQEITQRPVYSIEYDPSLANYFEYLPICSYFRIAPLPERMGVPRDFFINSGISMDPNDSK